MKVNINKNSLLKAVSFNQANVGKKTSMPILTNLLISVNKNTFTVSASDLSLTSISSVECESINSFSFIVDAKIFFEIVKELPSADVILEYNESENQINLKSLNTEIDINIQNSNKYPGLPGMDIEPSYKIDVATFLNMINKTLYAVSHDESRFNLNGVYFTLNDDDFLTLVSTDGFRLSSIKKQISGLELDNGFIVPTRGLVEIKKILENSDSSEVSFGLEQGFLVLANSDSKVVLNLIDGEFPDYKQVVPESFISNIQIPRDSFLQAIKRSSLVIIDDDKVVELSFSKDNLQISGSSSELGKAIDTLTIDFNEKDFKIGFNSKYLIDMLNSFNSDTITMNISDGYGATSFTTKKEEGYFAVVMPVRL